ncbi:MAG: (2Fe-2S) ferredoxin domain-containing protein [Gammaproteobacteria bacterium]|nr:(2Fe-2S) ferredoxin domain-containing protein [Gammaproteobacteria bacterium]
MSFYTHHVFFCTNQRKDGRACCQDSNAGEAREHAKKRIKELGLSGQGKVRINTAGCLDRCDLGPVMVIYPGETWYTFVDNEDVDEIIDEHLLNDRPVARLQI